MYFYKFTKSGKAIVTTTAPLGQTIETKNIGGIEVPVRVQSQDVSFGFTAIDAGLSSSMNLQVGDELPLEITDKPVINTETGEVIPNLFWAH